MVSIKDFACNIRYVFSQEGSSYCLTYLKDAEGLDQINLLFLQITDFLEVVSQAITSNISTKVTVSLDVKCGIAK